MGDASRGDDQNYECSILGTCAYPSLRGGQHHCKGCKEVVHNLCWQALTGVEDDPGDGFHCGGLVCRESMDEDEKRAAMPVPADHPQAATSCAAGKGCEKSATDTMTARCPHGNPTHFDCMGSPCVTDACKSFRASVDGGTAGGNVDITAELSEAARKDAVGGGGGATAVATPTGKDAATDGVPAAAKPASTAKKGAGAAATPARVTRVVNLKTPKDTPANPRGAGSRTRLQKSENKRQRDDEERVVLDATQMQLGAVRETVTKAVQESFGEAVTETAALKSLNKALAANSPLLLDQAKTLGMQMLQYNLAPRLTDVTKSIVKMETSVTALVAKTAELPAEDKKKKTTKGKKKPLSPEEQRSNELQAALVKTVGEKVDEKTAALTEVGKKALTEVGKKLADKLTASEAESNSGSGSGDVELLRGELVAVRAEVKELREEVKGLTTQLEEGFTKTCSFLSSHMSELARKHASESIEEKPFKQQRRQPLDTIHRQDAGYVMTPTFNGHGVANQQALTSPFVNGGGYNIQAAIPGMPNFAMGAGQGQTPSAQPPQFHFCR